MSRNKYITFLVPLIIVSVFWFYAMEDRYSVFVADKKLLAAYGEHASINEVQQRFQEAVIMLHAKKYDYALKSLERLLKLVPNMPEVYVNIGFSLIGLEQFANAREYFNHALILNKNQLNAYYGLGFCFNALGDYPNASRMLETFIHLGKAEDLYVEKAKKMLERMPLQ